MKFLRISSSQMILLGFAAVILLGSFLLMLPFATRDGMGATFGDALFTATSAVCVTGLVVQDTATYWSIFGQGVILAMIQVGGLGVVSAASALAIFSGKRIGLKYRSTMQEALSAPQVGGIVKLTGFVLKTTLLLEGIGAAVLTPVFCREFGAARGIWYAVFHSVSAFCNAGFDLMGNFSSLTRYAGNPIVNVTVMALIIVGGIGFLVWEDVRVHKFRLHRYRMQSKVVFVTSVLLIVLPAIYFAAAEGMDLLPALFQSVTARTAGFNTVDLGGMSAVGILLMILLMLVGGSPGSTAGGMKTTTLAVLVSTMIAVFRRREHTCFFGRRIGSDVIRTAVAILMMYLCLSVGGAAVISIAEGLPLLACLFETGSAVATVGLSLGLTPTLSALSRGVLIVLMFTGRVGGLTVVFAAAFGQVKTSTQLPQEKITVG